MKKYLYLLLIFLLFCGLGYGLYRSVQSKDVDEEEAVVEESDEEVEVEHLLKLTIIGPEGESFVPEQARMYNSFLEGNGKYDFANVRCNLYSSPVSS